MKNAFLVVDGISVGATMPELFVSTVELDAWIQKLKRAMAFYGIEDMTPDTRGHAPSVVLFLQSNVSEEFADRMISHRKLLETLERDEPNAIRRSVLTTLSAQCGLSLAQSKQIYDLFGETFDLSVVYYRVQTGDTISKIAEKFSVPIETIVKENRIENPDFIRRGDTLRIPNESVEPRFTKI